MGEVWEIFEPCNQSWEWHLPSLASAVQRHFQWQSNECLICTFTKGPGPKLVLLEPKPVGELD